MTAFGRYSPTREEHTSSLWSYGEVPVASAKLNTWNGNLAAALDFLHNALAQLLGADAADFVLRESGEELRVVAQTTPDMTITVQAGRAWIGGFLCGLDADTTLPATGTLAAPSANPRLDVVYLDAYGEPHLLAGSESGAPVVPDIPSGTLKGYLTDSRVVRILGRAHEHPGGADRQPSESADGARVQFTTPHAYRSGTLRVWLNGVEQDPDAAFSEDAGNHGYTFSTAPLAGDRISHDYEKEGA